MVLQLLTLIAGCSLSSLLLEVKATVVWPPEETVSKYFCKEYKEKPGTIELLWVSSSMGDVKVSEVLNLMLTTSAAVSPLGKFLVGRKILTHIPDQIRQFPQLDFVLLSDNNITSIVSEAFNFTSKLRYLSLGDNQLTTIAPGAFQGKL